MMNSQFILGFIAGEGSFSYKSVERGRFNFYIQPEFTLKVKEREILELILDEIGIGYNYTDDNEMTTWRTSSRDEKLQLIEFIDTHADEMFKSTQKYQSYVKWKELVERKPELIKSKEGVKEMAELAYSINPYGTRSNARTLEEVYEIVDSSQQHFCEEPAKNGPCSNPVNSSDEKCYRHS